MATMTGETAREVSTNPEVLKRLAKYLAQQCFAIPSSRICMPGLLRTRRSATTRTWSSGRPAGRFPGQTFRGSCGCQLANSTKLHDVTPDHKE